ncbi:MAG: TIGR03936 family radical SAM-associated protein [Planctomycetes bacterium]|nr:TIGR03936 family radical SAM-associated protein [Planctomycetota bacterium]
MFGDKLRFRFSKTGTLRLLSHHDLMRCLERMLRRAALPFKSTAGFHPGPRVVFALSLPLGVAGLDEVVEIEFLKELDADETLAQLRSQAPDGLAFNRVSILPMKITGVPRRIVYRLAIPEERVETVTLRCAELLAQEKVWVERLKPNPKRLNIRPYLRNLSVVRSLREREAEPLAERADHILALDLWVTGTGTARADELMKLLNVTDLIDAGSVVERSTVELRDEFVGTDPADIPPDGQADTLPLDAAAIANLIQQKEEDQLVSALGPVVE